MELLRLCLDWWKKVEWNERERNFNECHCLNAIKLNGVEWDITSFHSTPFYFILFHATNYHQSKHTLNLYSTNEKEFGVRRYLSIQGSCINYSSCFRDRRSTTKSLQANKGLRKEKNNPITKLPTPIQCKPKVAQHNIS